MREVLNRLVALLALVSFLVIAAAIAFSGKGGQVFDKTVNGVGTALYMIGQGFIILFCTALGLGIAYGAVKIWQATRVHVIRDGKDGQIARSIVYKGEVVQMMSTMFDAVQQGDMQIKQLEYFDKAFKMMLQATKAADRLIEEEEYEEEEPLQIEAPADEYLHISEDYKPHADEFLSAKKLVVGITGSGKSNSVGTLCEELGRLDVPMILADTENEYEPLCNPRWLPQGTLADRTMVNPDNAAEFGRYVLEHNLQVILNLQSYELEEGAWVMVNLIAGLRSWQEARANEVRIPFEFLLEEATTWLPQNVKESPLSGADVMSRLQDAFFNDMVRKGRKRGLGLTVICQKIAEIDKRALQCEVKLLHRQTELVDLEKYSKMGISHEETLSLANGEGYFFSSKVSKMLMQVRRRHSPHGADTPGLSALRRHQQSLRNFDEMSEISEADRNPFGQVVEPFRGNISEFRKPVTIRSDDIPETTKTAILDLYREGYKRTEIQEKLSISGDGYWMVKAVCDEDDRVRGA